MKIKSICLLLSLILILSFSMISCFNNDPVETTKQDSPPNNETVISGTEKIINVYLIAGQSNAVGYGMDTGRKIANSDERFVYGFENVLYYGSQERWNGKNTDKGFEPVKLGMGVAADRSGAEIGIASAIADNGEMNAIIKCAWGATHLYPDTNYDISLTQGTWTSPSYIEKNNVDLSKNPLIGNMYNRFEDTVIKGLQLLIEDGYTPVIKGVWWMQGEAEMFTVNMASAYKELFETLINDTRDMLGKVTGYDCSNVPFVCGLPKWNTNNSPAPAYQSMVREAMKNVANKLNNVGYVDCMPLTQHDDWHFDAPGQKYLGEGFVAAINEFEAENESEFKEQLSIGSEIELLVDEQGFGFKANLTKFSDDNDYQYGFLVVPTAELVKNNIKNQYFENLNNLYINYEDIPAELCVEKIDEQYYDIYFTGKLTKVAYENLNTKYTVIAYVKNSYGTYMYSAPSVSTSVANLASEELYKDTENAEAIQKIITAAINFLNNVPFENRENEAAFDLIVEESVNIKFSESTSNYQLIVENSLGVDYFVKYLSDNPEVIEVDENGLLTVKGIGNATIAIECAGKSKQVSVNVEAVSFEGIAIDGVISEGEYVGKVISATNGNLSVKFSGMTKDGNLYMSFELTHGEWAPISTQWWVNDNIEIKFNNGASHTVVFYEGIATYSDNISYGVSNTVEVGGKLVTTVEICVENADDAYQLKVGFNGANFGWLGAIWSEYVNSAFITMDGIVIDDVIYMNNGILLDGVFNENAYTENVKTNVITANGNGADVEIMGALLDDGVLFGVTVNHKKAPNITMGNGDWYTFLNIEFHFNGGGDQYLITAKNITTFGQVFAYAKTVQTDDGYTTTFEMFVPYKAIGVGADVESVGFTARGWFETGWCDLLNTTWDPTHTVTKDGLFEIK